MRVFSSEDELLDEKSRYIGCPDCETDDYLMDLDEEKAGKK
jgi:hypothetical protein